jgi:hypothetical protein
MLVQMLARLRQLLVLSLLLLAAATVVSANGEERYTVVELFTSQGCNSCPPADSALSALLDTGIDGADVIALEWHVDYWDYLGWPDPYASAAASQRQRLYASTIRSRMFTPQMVVNGQRVVSAAHRADVVAVEVGIAQQRRGAGAPEVEIASLSPSGATVAVDYRLRDVPANSVLTVLLVEDGLSNHVPRGENAGRTLHHVHTVRAQAGELLPRRSALSGSLLLAIPATVELSRSSVIALVQNAQTLRVIAATEVPVAQAAS